MSDSETTEDAIEAGIEAASEAVSGMAMGQKAWGAKEFEIARTAARAAVAARTTIDYSERSKAEIRRAYQGARIGLPDAKQLLMVGWDMESNEALSYLQPRYTLRRDDQGFAAAIERDGYTVLILATGAERNEQEAEAIVSALNRVER